MLKKNKQKTLLILVNVDWFFLSHRLSIALKAINEGWLVYVACADSGRSNEIIKTGIKYINIPISRSGLDVFNELNTIAKLYKIYKRINPDIVHHVTLKPILYGSFISKFISIKGVINAVSGLGYVFTNEKKAVVRRILIQLLKYTVKNKNTVFIFQNKEDYKEFVNLNILGPKNNSYFIKGSGVDLNSFKYSAPSKKEFITILLPCRMLWSKGLKELKEASEILKTKFKGQIIFILAGSVDSDNKASVGEKYLRNWEERDYVKWIGFKNEMYQIYKESDIVVLPSYREGIPKSLIEACATGRPIVTTNAVGCKDCVDEGVNGYCVPVKSSKELAFAIEKLVSSNTLRDNMGKKSRIKAENEFSLRGVIGKHLDIYNELYER